jgi:acetylornithine deacetylase/succinyl-diaminopimelate desuccinylase-like protein
MPLNLTKTLIELVGTPSVNPMGRAVSGAEFYEHQITALLEKLLADCGIPTTRQPIAEKRDNLLARVDGDPPLESGGRLVVLEVHQDTVPVEGMTIPPFAAEVREGRLYGRGSCDVKGGMAAMLGALVQLAEERPRPRPTVVLACTVNEEHGFTGATGLCELWGRKADPLFPRKPDGAIVAEPSNLRVVVAHKGMVRWRCHTRGRAAHSCDPQLGNNAIYSMGRVVRALEHYAREVVGGLAEHPLCGRPTLSVGTIRGGVSVNIVPESATIEIDRRLVPGEEPETAWRHVAEFVARESGVGDCVEHERPFMQSRGLSDRDNRTLAEKAMAAAREVIGNSAGTIGVAFGTDAAAITAAGVPCVVFGPGSIDQAHTADEWVPMGEVEQAAEILYRLLTNW